MTWGWFYCYLLLLIEQCKLICMFIICIYLFISICYFTVYKCADLAFAFKRKSCKNSIFYFTFCFNCVLEEWFTVACFVSVSAKCSQGILMRLVCWSHIYFLSLLFYSQHSTVFSFVQVVDSLLIELGGVSCSTAGTLGLSLPNKHSS